MIFFYNFFFNLYRLRNIFNCVLLQQRHLTAGFIYNDFAWRLWVANSANSTSLGIEEPKNICPIIPWSICPIIQMKVKIFDNHYFFTQTHYYLRITPNLVNLCPTVWHLKVYAVDFPTQLLRAEELKNAVEHLWLHPTFFQYIHSDFHIHLVPA